MRWRKKMYVKKSDQKNEEKVHAPMVNALNAKTE